MKNKYYLAALLIFVIDHITKLLARSNLESGRMIEIIPGYLRLSYARNTGVAFGLFDALQSAWKPYILASLAIVALAVIIFYSMRMPRDRNLLQLALALTMGGILGNFLDRIIRGYVIDFVEFHIREKFYWPNFNVADSAISIGIVLLLIDTFIHPASEDASEHKTAADHANE
jgi:signal peptidase II